MGVLEYKNPYKFRDMTPVEAANQSTNCCLIEKNGSLSLKQTHTVGANKKFKNGMKFLLQRLSMHCLYGFRTVTFITAALYTQYCSTHDMFLA